MDLIVSGGFGWRQIWTWVALDCFGWVVPDFNRFDLDYVDFGVGVTVGSGACGKIWLWMQLGEFR